MPRQTQYELRYDSRMVLVSVFQWFNVTLEDDLGYLAACAGPRDAIAVKVRNFRSSNQWHSPCSTSVSCSSGNYTTVLHRLSSWFCNI